MASILVPVLYLVIIVGGLLIFSSFYRKGTKTKRYEPWFPQHRERDTYVTLLQQTNPPASEAILKAALIRRAIADVNRVLRIREDKPALQNLLQKGSVSDDLWNAFLSAEKEMEAEILEVMQEANSFVEGWGQIIFTTAGEMVANEKFKKIFDSIPEEKVKLEAKYGIRKKAITSSEKPLSTSSNSTTSAATPSDAAATNGHGTPSPATSPEPINGLAPPPSNVDADSATSSDGEGGRPTTPPKPSKSTPNKSSNKKGKKRK